MKTYIAKWPNGSVSILNALDKVELFDRLDIEGDPYCCTLFEIKSEFDHFHIGFEIANQSGETFIDVDNKDEWSKLKQVKLPKDAFERNLALKTGRPLKEIKANPNMPEIKKQMGIDQ